VQLPQIDLGGVEDEESPGLRNVGAAASGLGRVVEEGLSLFGRELVKTQTQEASLNLSKGLDDLQHHLTGRKAIPEDEIKSMLGEARYRELPAEVRDQPEIEVMDERTGQLVRRKRDVPTWAVAGELFDVAAEKVLADAESRITVGKGWRGAFRGAAAQDLLTRKAALNHALMPVMLEEQKEERKRQAIEFANAGDTRSALAVARGALEVMGAKDSQALEHEVIEIAQTKPVYDALRMVNLPAYKEKGVKQLEAAAASLGDPTRYTELSPKELTGLSNAVQAAMNDGRGLILKAQAARLAFDIAQGARDTRNHMRINPGAAYDALDAKVKAGEVTPDMGVEVAKLIGAHVTDRKAAVDVAFGEDAGDAATEFMALGPDGTPHMNFANVRPETLARLRSYGKEGTDFIASLIKWDQSNESHNRSVRQAPTLAESAKALALEYAMETQPGKFRSMAPGRYLAILSGEGDAELGIPAGVVSGRDFPELSTKFANNAAPVKPAGVTDDAAMIWEEASEAYPILKVKPKPGKKVPAPEHVRKTMKYLKDEYQKFIDRSINDTGAPPNDAAKRGELQRLLGSQKVRSQFMGIPYEWASTTEEVPHAEAVATGRELVEELEPPETAPVPPPTSRATPPPAAKPRGKPPVPGAVHVTNGKTGAWLRPGQKMPAGWRED
jgi:hypothetical protein